MNGKYYHSYSYMIDRAKHEPPNTENVPTATRRPSKPCPTEPCPMSIAIEPPMIKANAKMHRKIKKIFFIFNSPFEKYKQLILIYNIIIT